MATATSTPPIARGMTLPNGAKVLQATKTDDDSWVILCRWNSETPFATWATDDEGRTHWGHYFASYERGLVDFHHRVRRGY